MKNIATEHQLYIEILLQLRSLLGQHNLTFICRSVGKFGRVWFGILSKWPWSARQVSSYQCCKWIIWWLWSLFCPPFPNIWQNHACAHKLKITISVVEMQMKKLCGTTPTIGGHVFCHILLFDAQHFYCILMLYLRQWKKHILDIRNQ